MRDSFLIGGLIIALVFFLALTGVLVVLFMDESSEPTAAVIAEPLSDSVQNNVNLDSISSSSGSGRLPNGECPPPEIVIQQPGAPGVHAIVPEGECPTVKYVRAPPEPSTFTEPEQYIWYAAKNLNLLEILGLQSDKQWDLQRQAPDKIVKRNGKVYMVVQADYLKDAFSQREYHYFGVVFDQNTGKILEHRSLDKVREDGTVVLDRDAIWW